MTDRPDTPTDAQQVDSSAPDPDCLLEEYDLEGHEVLRGVLHDLKWGQPVGEEAVRAYLAEESEKEERGRILHEIQSEEALEVASLLVRRKIRETDARLRLRKAQEAFDRAYQEKNAAAEHLLSVLRRTADLPSDTKWGVDPTRGTVHESGFDPADHLFGLATRIFEMAEPELAVIAENGGELFPDEIEQSIGRIEEEVPGLKVRDLLADLAVELLQFEAPGREFVLSMIRRPGTARAIAEDESRSRPLRLIAQLRTA